MPACTTEEEEDGADDSGEDCAAPDGADEADVASEDAPEAASFELAPGTRLAGTRVLPYFFVSKSTASKRLHWSTFV